MAIDSTTLRNDAADQLEYCQQLLVDEAKWLQEDGRLELAAKVFRVAERCRVLAEQCR